MWRMQDGSSGSGRDLHGSAISYSSLAQWCRDLRLAEVVLIAIPSRHSGGVWTFLARSNMVKDLWVHYQGGVEREKVPQQSKVSNRPLIFLLGQLTSNEE